MSYSEYFDLFYDAQKRDCKYRAFMIDVKGSKKTFQSFILFNSMPEHL